MLMSQSSCETGSRTKRSRLSAPERWADSLRETVRTPTKSMMQLLAKSSFSCQSGGSQKQTPGGTVRCSRELASAARERRFCCRGKRWQTPETRSAEEELWRRGVPVSLNRREDVLAPTERATDEWTKQVLTRHTNRITPGSIEFACKDGTLSLDLCQVGCSHQTHRPPEAVRSVRQTRGTLTTASDYVQNNIAGGTASDSDDAETSNEQGRTGRFVHEDFRSGACTGEACYTEVEGAPAAVVAQSGTECICVYDASWRSVHEQCFDDGLQHSLKGHVSLRAASRLRHCRVHSVLVGQKLFE